MRLQIMSRARNIVWHKPFGFGLFSHHIAVLAGPIRVDLLWA